VAGKPPYQVRLAPLPRRAITEKLPEAVAAAALELIHGALSADPYRVGCRLQEPFADQYCARRGTYRILYQIDEERRVITITDVKHRSVAYHPRD
jgi:mRNA interferase RelE/StbE